MTDVNLVIPGATPGENVVGTGNVVELRVPGVEIPATLGMGGTVFTWDLTNAQSQEVDPGKYYIKTEVTDEYGHVNVIIKDVMVVRIEEYIELKIYNSAGELVRTIRQTGVPVPDMADLSYMGDIIVIEKNGSAVGIKYGPTMSESLPWDGKTEEGKVVSSGNYELQLTVKTETGNITGASKTVVVLREDKTYLEKLEIWPNPFTMITFPAQVSFNWTCLTAGETGDAYVRVFNVAGELVWQARAALEAGTVAWNLRTASGEHISRGFYFCVIITKNAQGYTDMKTQKMAVLSYEGDY